MGNLYEVKGSEVTKYYYMGSRRVEMNKAGTLSYLHSDHLGSTSVTTNAGGGCTSAQWYKPYGENRAPAPTLPCAGSAPTDFGFTGQRKDASAGLLYYGARYYDPALGRFISADSVVPSAGDPQALNRYSYARNNPLKYTDPSGHCWGAANGVRSLPSYDVTCGNMDMALTIVQHPNASGVEKAFAGWYLVAEGTAHVSVAVGGSILGWYAIAPATAVGEAVCMDGDCTNEATATTKLLSTGARQLKAEDFKGAEKAYNVIRELTDDADQIAKNTGMTREMINTVKQHVFENTHILDRFGETYKKVGRFDADPFIANAWERLRANTFTQSDLQLLKHEFYEWQLEQGGLTYGQAHEVARKLFPWDPTH